MRSGRTGRNRAQTRSLYGEGQGVVLAPDGNAATWKGAGVGKFVGGGSVSYRGAVYYSSASPKFARLNAVAQPFEFEVDAEGNTHTKGWEWKVTREVKAILSRPISGRLFFAPSSALVSRGLF